MTKIVVFAAVVVLSFGAGDALHAGTLGDVDHDGHVGLTEAVHALEVTSGVLFEVPASYVMVWRGTWAADEAYDVYDAVQYEGSSYICIQKHTSTALNGPPDPGVWNILALEGEQGPPGDSSWGSSGSNAFYTDGNVGIGTTAPAEKLDVNGDINTSGAYKIDGATAFEADSDKNTFVGFSAGFLNAGGEENTFMGFEAGKFNTAGNKNAFIGYSAGFSNDTGTQNTFLGFGAGSSNTSGDKNTYLGAQAGSTGYTPGENTFVGAWAGLSNTTGEGNTFVGAEAGYSNEKGKGNVFVGKSAGFQNNKSHNTFIGAGAGYESTQDQNTFVGFEAGYKSSVYGGTFIGYLAGRENTSGSRNTYVGTGAGYKNTTGDYNTFIGYEAGAENIAGQLNAFLGNGAGGQNTGSSNTLIGAAAGSDHQTGDGNTFIGSSAGQKHENGEENTYIGSDAGLFNQSGVGNVFLGFSAGSNEMGSYRLYIDNSDTSSPLIWGDFQNDILTVNGKMGIGTTSPARALHIVGANPRILVEGEGASSPEINFKGSSDLSGNIWALYKHGTAGDLRFYQGGDKVTIQNTTGNVGIGTTDPGTYKLAVNGEAVKAGSSAWDTFSDVRLKDITEDFEYGLEEILRMHPVVYRYKEENAMGLPSDKEHAGLVAQEVQEVIPEAVNENEQGYLLVNETPINLAMLNAIKELKCEVEELRQRIRELEAQR